jgi:hypothetical protein
LTGHHAILAVIGHGFFAQNAEDESRSYMLKKIFDVEFAEI